jgi:nucleotide-binding universal stress UspA family protein
VCIGAGAQAESALNPERSPQKQNVKPLLFVASDLGVNSRKSEKTALEWASKLKADGVLFHSLREALHPVIQTAYAAGPGSMDVESLIAPHRERARKALDLRAKAWSRKKLRCQVILDEKHASAESGILEAIRETQQSRSVTFAFLGTHGRNLAARAFLGSTAREVVLGGPIPVVTVKS